MMEQVVVTLSEPDDFEGWRRSVKALIHAQIHPDRVLWQIEGAPADLLAGEEFIVGDAPGFDVSKDFIYMASRAIQHSNPDRFGLLHKLLLEVLHRPGLMRNASDPLVFRVHALHATIRRDMHKMRAFVRFRRTVDDEGSRWVAWFEPEHHIVRANVPFFAKRYTNMRWSILTPDVSVHWDGSRAWESPGADRKSLPPDDGAEDLWRVYFRSTFNPARLNTTMMIKEMPKKYWKNLPEAHLVKELVDGAANRERKMIEDSKLGD